VLRTFAGLFLIAHGLVHILYVVQSVRPGGVIPGLVWPDGSWAFARSLGVKGTRRLAAGLCAVATAAFVVAGLAVALRLGWWPAATAAAAVFSAAVFVLLWDGGRRRLHDQGLIGVLLDAGVLAAALLLV
jgi:hypothetical protein